MENRDCYLLRIYDLIVGVLWLGEHEETKKQKQKALIEAAFKTNQKSKNDSIATENGDGENSDDGKWSTFW